MRTLVTGGAGLIGSGLVDALLARGDAVIVLDDLSTGSRGNLPGRAPGLELVVGSVCDESLVRELVAGADLVLHFAAAVGVEHVRTRPLDALATNVRGSDVVIRAAAAAGGALVVASSSEVYGDAEAPIGEDAPLRLDHTGRLRTGYASAKVQAECAAFAHALERGTDVLVVRVFNTTGPRQSARYGMVLPRLVDQALGGRPLTVFGDGSQTRCFAHVDDVVASVLGLVDAGRFGRVFNVGSDEETSIRALADRVIAETAVSVGIEYVPFERAHPGFAAGPRRRVPALGRLREALGAVPSRPLVDLVRDVVAARRARSLVARAGAWEA